MKKFITTFITTICLSSALQAQSCWKIISSGYTHTLAIRSDGTLWAWGDNTVGELGDGTTANKNKPVQVGTDNTWIEVSACREHSSAIKSDGTLWAWGYNYEGQVGDGTRIDKNQPVQIGTDKDWKSLASVIGGFYSMAVKTNGSIWGWGANSGKQLINSSTSRYTIPTQIGTDLDWKMISSRSSNGSNSFTYALKTNGTLWGWGGAAVQIGTDTDWSLISSGYDHTLGIKSDGSLWAWGGNGQGQLGDNSKTAKSVPVRIGSENNWKDVKAGDGFSLALKTDGTLWAWGYNLQGQLGFGNTNSPLEPTKVGTETNWDKIAAGSNFSMAIKTTGNLFSMGRNYEGQLGIGTSGVLTDKNVPTQVSCINVTSGIESEELNLNTIQIFPNPVNDKLNIYFKNDINSNHYFIYNSLGVVLQKGSISNQSIFIADLEKGVYYLELENQGAYHKLKFVKN